MNRKAFSQIASACILASFLAIYGVAQPAPALAAPGTITVSTLLDVYGGSACSLRNAVIAANTGAAFGGCPAGDHIMLPAGNLKLTILNPGGVEADAKTGDLDIMKGMTITGSGVSSTMVYAAGSAFGDRIFHIHPGATVTLQKMKISGGFIPAGYGGGIFNDGGILSLDRVTLNGNEVHITAGGAGGGIANVGSASQLSIDYSTISSNKALYGGGIFNLGGNLSINHSAVYMNRAGVSGGGLATQDDFNVPSIATITNSTFSANNAVSGGGILTSSSELSLRSTTIADNDRDGLYVSGFIPTIKNTLFARNKVNCALGSGTIISSSGYNLLDTSPNECLFDNSSDLLNQDPMLTSTMSSHAGPTLTYGFLSTASPAIDPPGNLDCPADDQRGLFTRPLDGNSDGIATCDIGAYEEKQLYYINLPVTVR